MARQKIRNEGGSKEAKNDEAAERPRVTENDRRWRICMGVFMRDRGRVRLTDRQTETKTEGEQERPTEQQPLSVLFIYFPKLRRGGSTMPCWMSMRTSSCMSVSKFPAEDEHSGEEYKSS